MSFAAQRAHKLDDRPPTSVRGNKTLFLDVLIHAGGQLNSMLEFSFPCHLRFAHLVNKQVLVSFDFVQHPLFRDHRPNGFY